MKNLKESLFDKDLVQKEYTIGDYYKPWVIRVRGEYISDCLKKVSNMFVMSKLEKIAKPISLDGVIGYNAGLKKHYEFLEYILGAIDILPVPLEMVKPKKGKRICQKEIDKIFEGTVRNGLYQKTLSIDLWANEFSENEPRPMLKICKSGMSEWMQIEIIYTKKNEKS